MICDTCIKKGVCKLYDGSDLLGCIEFYRSHVEVLQDLRKEMMSLFLPLTGLSEEDDMRKYANDTLSMAIARIDGKIDEYSEMF